MGKPTPTPEEEKLAALRIRSLDAIDPYCDWGSACPSYEALKARERRNKIMDEQNKFEEKYC